MNNIKNPYDKTVYGIGYLGIGKYRPTENGKHTVQYDTWKDMLKRCYSGKFQEKYPSYIGCKVDSKWHCYNTFATWFDENLYEIEGIRIELDKDILLKGNKIYSQNTCVLVPQNINLLFSKQDRKRGKYPIGVTYDKSKRKYVVRCMNSEGQYKNIGRFTTVEDAFSIYKFHKEKYIKEVAERYKDKIPYKLYEAMLNYEVEIYD